MVTIIEFISNDQGRLIGFAIKGHSGYAARGLDIVCAGISTMAQAAIHGITEIAQVKAVSATVLAEVRMSIIVTDRNPTQFEKAEFMLQTAKAVMEGICTQYPDYARMFELSSNVL